MLTFIMVSSKLPYNHFMFLGTWLFFTTIVEGKYLTNFWGPSYSAAAVEINFLPSSPCPGWFQFPSLSKVRPLPILHQWLDAHCRRHLHKEIRARKGLTWQRKRKHTQAHTTCSKINNQKGLKLTFSLFTENSISLILFSHTAAKAATLHVWIRCFR